MTGGSTRITVTGVHPYDVVIGPGATTGLAELVGPAARQVAVLRAPPVRGLATRLGAGLERSGYLVRHVELPDGEAAKRVEVAATCWAALGRAGFTRTDVLVAVGGGAVTDLAGFVAAGWLRGVPVVHVPTTLLGMVDAAVGGKSGVNTDEGKNLVGAFHDPAGVLCDLDVLEHLPADQLASGLAEVVKCGFVADPVILDLVERDPVAAADPTGPTLRELVERAVRVKAAVVGSDRRETATTGVGREVLNYGHTLGHAIERREHYRWRHGAAVSVGLVYAAELAQLAGRLDRAVADRHLHVLTSVGLPTTYPADAWPDLLAAMRVDKKARGDQLRFVVLDGLARPAILAGPSPDLLEAAYAATAR